MPGDEILSVEGLEDLLSDQEQLRIQVKMNRRLMRLFGSHYSFGKHWNRTNPRFTYNQIERILKDSPAKISVYELVSNDWRVGSFWPDYYSFERIHTSEAQIDDLYELVFHKSERMYGAGSQYIGINPH